MTLDEARALLAAALRTEDSPTILAVFDVIEDAGFPELVEAFARR